MADSIALPGIDREMQEKKQINKSTIAKMISRLQEGDLDSGVL